MYKTLGIFIPFFNIVFFIALMFLPTSLTPWPVVWIYSTFILLTEPVLKISEGIVLLNFVMRKSQSAADEIEKDEYSSSNLYKGVILLFSSLCYGVSASLTCEIFNSGTNSQLICLFIIICFCLAAHNMMLMAHEGIVSDCAFTCLLNIGVLYMVMKETSNTISEPTAWKQILKTSTSTMDIVYNIVFTNTDNAQKAIVFFQRFITPVFGVCLLIRLNSILFIVKKITRNFFQDQEEETIISLEEEIAPPWKSPFMLKVAVIFMFTQLCVVHFSDWEEKTLNVVLKLVCPPDLVLSRLLQIITFSLFYMWRLYRAEDWTWNIWLTP
ncbi:hypothetical protein Btru_019259 [Bulinus truncatus]|nr:hypothetical protein Btru_019259 [Bulinus truncatus]